MATNKINQFFRSSSFKQQLDDAFDQLKNKNTNNQLTSDEEKISNLLILNYYDYCVYKTASDHMVIQYRTAVTNPQNEVAA